MALNQELDNRKTKMKRFLSLRGGMFGDNMIQYRIILILGMLL